MKLPKTVRDIIIALTAACSVCFSSCSLFNENSDNKDSKVDVGKNESFAKSDTSSCPNENDGEILYDTTPISQAYLTENTSSLDDFQLSIYNKAVQIIDGEISDEMTDYQKELAIHDYLIKNCEYDEGLLTVLGGHGKNAENPYGALIDGKAICSGYTTSFQMFMDMLEIPCKSIKAGDSNNEEHAWNMVEINDKWYYVDVTWDDPVPDRSNRPTRHSYFNVTYDIMAERHVWDSNGYPEANNYEDSYTAHNLHKVSDWSEVAQAMEDQLASGNEGVYFEFDDSMNISLEEADEINDSLSAERLSDDLKKVTDDFAKEHKGIAVYCRRAAYGDGAVLEILMKKQ